MIRLCEIIGLLPEQMAEVTGFVMATIAFGVFMGICMFYALISAANLFWTGVEFVVSLIRKHFPNVRKRKERT